MYSNPCNHAHCLHWLDRFLTNQMWSLYTNQTHLAKALPMHYDWPALTNRYQLIWQLSVKTDPSQCWSYIYSKNTSTTSLIWLDNNRKAKVRYHLVPTQHRQFTTGPCNIKVPCFRLNVGWKKWNVTHYQWTQVTFVRNTSYKLYQPNSSSQNQI